MVAALHAVSQVELHVVAQVVEAEFVIGAVCNIGTVSLATLIVIELVNNYANRKAEEIVDLAHPLGVAFDQIVVYRNHVNATASQRIEINRESRHKGFSFAGLHLGDLALVKHHAAHELNVEVAHIEDAASSFANYRKRFFEHLVESGFHHRIALRLAGGKRLFVGRLVDLSVSDLLLDSRAKFRGPGAKLLIRELLHLGFESADPQRARGQPLDFAFILGAKYLGDNICKQKRYPLYPRTSEALKEQKDP